MYRGNNEYPTLQGSTIDGRNFFAGEDDAWYPWRQAGGINAGVIVLSPNHSIYSQMWREVTCDAHPEHVQGNGPEQDYFSRFFADAPWHNIDVEYNYQIHHIPFALEHSLMCRGYAAAYADYATAEDSSFL